MDRYFVDLEEKKQVKKTDKYLTTLKLYVAPLGAVSIFILLMFILVLPKISSVIDKVSEFEQKTAELEKQRGEFDDVVALRNDSIKVFSDLDKINSITTTEDTQIVDFRDRISGVASSSGLTIVSQKIRETVPVEENSNALNQQTLLLQEIPVVFELAGDLDSIFRFIEDLSAVNDFVIIKTFQLSKNLTAEDQWNLELQFTKYQFNQETSSIDFDTIFNNVPVTAVVETAVQGYLDAR